MFHSADYLYSFISSFMCKQIFGSDGVRGLGDILLVLLLKFTLLFFLPILVRCTIVVRLSSGVELTWKFGKGEN